LQNQSPDHPIELHQPKRQATNVIWLADVDFTGEV